MLLKNGLLIITCPNIKGFDITVLGALSDIIDHEHLNYFNPQSISCLLKDCGFEVLEILTPENANEYTFAARKGTTAYGFIKNNYENNMFDEEKVVFPIENEKLFSMVENKLINFIIYDYARGLKLVESDEDLDMVRLSDKGFDAGKEQYGISVSNTEVELLKAINVTLEQSQEKIHELLESHEISF